MNRYTLEALDAATVQDARTKTAERIARYRRKAASIRRLADKLNGKYITARALPEIKTILEHDNVHLSKDGEEVTAYYGGGYQNADTIHLYLKERRADGVAMKKDAEACEATAAKLEKALNSMDALVYEYNAIVANYAVIRGDLNRLFDNLPDADFDLQRTADYATYTPDEFAELVG